MKFALALGLMMVVAQAVVAEPEVGFAAPRARAAAPHGAETPAPVDQSMRQRSPERVLRSAFTSAVSGHEPQNNILSLGNNEQRLFYFTELQGLEGQTVVHRWLYRGAVVAEVPFQVDGPRWRVWSSKTLLTNQLGAWSVQVIDGRGRIVGSGHFVYTEVNPVNVAAAPNP